MTTADIVITASAFFETAVESAPTLLATALALGLRHGIDWDHIAAITDITSTTAAAPQGVAALQGVVGAVAPAAAGAAPPPVAGAVAWPSPGSGAWHHLRTEQRRALGLGTLYALGHAAVLATLGLLAIWFGTQLPDWVDPVMSRVVGVTLVVLGIWVFVSLWAYFRHGQEFRLRSRWMLVFTVARRGWRRFRTRLDGHAHAEAAEMTSYGPRTAFGVGMIHGVGAETGTQVLIIAAIGGASGIGLGVPMLVAFVIGLLLSNAAIVLITATGFVASQLRQRIYLAAGFTAGTISLIVGVLFLLEREGSLPDLDAILGAVGVGG